MMCMALPVIVAVRTLLLHVPSLLIATLTMKNAHIRVAHIPAVITALTHVMWTNTIVAIPLLLHQMPTVVMRQLSPTMVMS